MEFRFLYIFSLGMVIVNPLGTAMAQTPSELISGSNLRYNSMDSVTINGTIIDSISGGFSWNDSITVKIDSYVISPDSGGAFFKRVPVAQYHTVTVISRQYAPFSQLIPENSGKKNFFVTCVLHKKNNVPTKSDSGSPKTTTVSGPCWTISGCIVDSKHDLAIESDSFTVTFDDSLIKITKRGSFQVNTCNGGAHVFQVKVPSYHRAIEQVDLKDNDKQPFIVIPTTKLKNKVTRRELTVTAKREPVHAIAAEAKTEITRAEVTRTASTFNDPMRVVQTLPGVAAESDASARPIVRGGDPWETRVFLDDVPLVQPYHFGGFRSMFNELAMDNITLYKSGFPAQYSNANSALLSVMSRRPLSEPFALGLNMNMLQTDGYIGIPIYKNSVGINASFQSSYYDFTYKRALDLSAAIMRNPEASLTVKQMEEDAHRLPQSGRPPTGQKCVQRSSGSWNPPLKWL